MVSNKVLIMYCLDFMIKVKTIEVIEKIGIVGYNNVYERCWKFARLLMKR